MPDFGFPAQHNQNAMARLIADLRQQGSSSRVEAVTGRFSDVTAERQGRVNELMHVEKSITDLQYYADSIALSEARADVFQQSLASMRTAAQDLFEQATMLASNGTNGDLAVVSTGARQSLDTMVSALNVDFAGRALFAGDQSEGSAIADAETIYSTSEAILELGATAAASYTLLENEFFGVGATFEATLYEGGTGTAPPTEIAAGELVNYAIKADETATRRVVFNTAALASAFDETNNIPASERRALLQLASEGLLTAISELVTLEGQIGAAQGRISTIKTRNIATEAALSIRFNELAGADQTSAALTLTELDRQLETAFATTARFSNLSLVNYL